MNDPIVDEVRRVRDAYAARFNYDLDAIFHDIKQREQEGGLLFSQGVARQPAASEAIQPTGTAPPISEAPKVIDAAPATQN